SPLALEAARNPSRCRLTTSRPSPDAYVPNGSCAIVPVVSGPALMSAAPAAASSCHPRVRDTSGTRFVIARLAVSQKRPIGCGRHRLLVQPSLQCRLKYPDCPDTQRQL